MTQDLATPAYPVQFKGKAWAQWLLRLAGWRYRFEGLPSLQGVLIAYPHTSNWDFVVMILVKWAAGIHIQFWAKDSLFRVPLFGAWLRWVGGVSLDRSSSSGKVGDMVRVLRQHKDEGRYFWLALSPEGTRKHTPGWRSGFYQLALQAQVPLALVRIDYGQRCIEFASFITLSGDEAQDYAQFAQVFADVRGCHVELASPIQPLKSNSGSTS
jgi:1-acyl-sn-glycerol-3-phosphate acyltransferase